MFHDVHERQIEASQDDLGELLESLATGETDRLWPHERWPPMRLDRPLSVGATGGHGGRFGARYEASDVEPGRRVRFTFTGPRGLAGRHEFEVVEGADSGTVLRHVLEVRCSGLMRVLWPTIYLPLHRACIEDALDKATHEAAGEAVLPRPHGRWVRLVRRVWGVLPRRLGGVKIARS